MTALAYFQYEDVNIFATKMALAYLQNNGALEDKNLAQYGFAGAK